MTKAAALAWIEQHNGFPSDCQSMHAIERILMRDALAETLAAMPDRMARAHMLRAEGMEIGAISTTLKVSRRTLREYFQK